MPNQNKNLENFFSPESIAIVGATDGVGKVGTVITRNILNLGYAGKIFLVNPKRNELFSQKCYARLEDIKDQVDLAVIAIPAPLVNEVVQNASAKINNFVIVSAGFGETDEKGKFREQELLDIANKNSLNILGPNCLGFIIPGLKINASFAGGMPKRGHIGFISQSGALAVALMDIFAKEDIGFSGIFSIGNKMLLDEADLIRHLANDTETEVIGLYLEGIKDGKKFLEATRKAAREKPVVILKAGKTEKSQKAISSHTGALAGNAAIARAVFEKLNLIEADTLSDFINLLKITSLAKPPLLKEIAVVTNAGGAGVLATDAFFKKTIKLAEIDEDVKNILKQKLPPASSVENPVDLLGDADAARFAAAFAELEKCAAGAFIVILTPQQQTPVEEIADKIISAAHISEKTYLTSFIGGQKVESEIKKLQSNGVLNFISPEDAVGSLDKLYAWNETKNAGIADYEANLESKHRAEKIIAKALSQGRKTLFFEEAEKIFKCYGINSVPTLTVRDKNNQKILKLPRSFSFPVVMKIDSEKILHKTEKKAVTLNIKNDGEYSRVLQKMEDYFPGERIIAQPMLEGQAELIVGIKRDPIFGPVVIYGLGGIYAEAFKKIGLLIPPVGTRETEKALEKSEISFLFKEFRGKKPINISEAASIIMKISQMAADLDSIRELDINPLFLYNDGRKAAAADIKIII